MPYANKQDLYKNQIQRWRKIKEKAVDYKGGKCNKCGLVEHASVYDFHHNDPTTKDVNWSKLKLRSWDKITFELDKCTLLCSNCHRLEHWSEY